MGGGACVSGVQDGRDAKTGRTHHCSVSFAPIFEARSSVEVGVAQICMVQEPVSQCWALGFVLGLGQGRRRRSYDFHQTRRVNGRSGHQGGRGGEARQGPDGREGQTAALNPRSQTQTRESEEKRPR